METTTINVRVDKKLKKDCKEIFNNLGFGLTTAITMYLKAVQRKNGIPFSLDIPNKKTLKAFEEVKYISDGKQKAKKYKNSNELRRDLKV